MVWGNVGIMAGGGRMGIIFGKRNINR